MQNPDTGNWIQYTSLCSITYLIPSVFSWCLKPHSPGVPKMFRQTSHQVYCWSCKFTDCLCLSTVSMAMASPSPANALPRLSVCRLMNTDWVNSRSETRTFKATWSRRNGERDTQPWQTEIRDDKSVFYSVLHISLSSVCLRLPRHAWGVCSSVCKKKLMDPIKHPETIITKYVR